MRFQHRDVDALLRQVQRGGKTGEATADHADIDAPIAIERWGGNRRPRGLGVQAARQRLSRHGSEATNASVSSSARARRPSMSSISASVMISGGAITNCSPRPRMISPYSRARSSK